MLALGIRYLTGCVVASEVARRSQPEWPPHPHRVFVALAAAHFQTGDEPTERAALEWLERLPAPPQLQAGHTELRKAVTHYVPVNDKAGPAKAPVTSAPGLTRERQPRTFAKAWLDNDTVFLVWPDAEPDATHRAALERLCGKVTRIGHSISLVQMWVEKDGADIAPNWVPDEQAASLRLRVAGVGTLEYLERVFNREGVEEFDRELEAATNEKEREKIRKKAPVRLWPDLANWHGYRAASETAASPRESGTWFSDRLLVLEFRRVDGPYRSLDVVSTLQITARLRDALQNIAKTEGIELPETITGHRERNVPSERPHVAFLPLPFSGHEHADGRLMGIALALPKDFPVADRRTLLRLLAALDAEGLKLGPLGKWRLGAPDSATPPVTLQTPTWTGHPAGAREWATVTPIALDQHAKAKDKAAYREETAKSIRDACTRIGLNVPVQVVVTPVSPHLGVPPAHVFPRLARKDGSERRHTHAILLFELPVVGPVFLGAGRYRGYGLCRPLEGGA